MKKLPFLALAAAVLAVGVSSVTFAGESDGPAREPAAVGDVPLAAFDRAAGPGDQVPSHVAPGLVRAAESAGGGVGESRLVARIGEHAIFAARIGRDGICVVDAVAESAAMTCNDVAGLRAGYLWIGGPDHVVGLVPDDVTRVQLLAPADEAVDDVRPTGGAYVAQRGRSFDAIRLSTPAGARTTRLGTAAHAAP